MRDELLESITDFVLLGSYKLAASGFSVVVETVHRANRHQVYDYADSTSNNQPVDDYARFKKIDHDLFVTTMLARDVVAYDEYHPATDRIRSLLHNQKSGARGIVEECSAANRVYAARLYNFV